MNKIKNILKIAFVALMVIPFMLFAQDSTHVVAGMDSGFLNGIFTYVSTKYPIIATISTILFLVSEVLAGIPSVKANSVFQLVYGVLKAIVGNKTAQVLLLVLSVSLVISCSHHSIPTKAYTVDSTDSISRTEKVVYRDTTIVIPGAVITIHDTIPCKDVIYHAEKDSAGVKATVDLKNGVLSVSCKEDSLRKVLLNLASDYIQLYKKKNETITITTPGPIVTVPYVPKWCWYLLGFVVLYFGLKFMALLITPSSSVTSFIFSLIKKAP